MFHNAKTREARRHSRRLGYDSRRRRNKLSAETLERRDLLAAYALGVQEGQNSYQVNFDVVNGDVVSFIVPATSTSGDVVRITFPSQISNLDLDLVDPFGNQFAATRPQAGVAEVSLAGFVPGSYVAVITGFAPFGAQYFFALETPFRITPDLIDFSFANDASNTATNLNSVDGTLDDNQAIVSANLHYNFSGTTPLSSDIDWYHFRTLRGTDAGSLATLEFFDSQGDIDLFLYSAANLGIPLFSSTTTTNDESINLSNLPPGDYFLQVIGKGGTSGNLFFGQTNPIYTLTVDINSIQPQPDLFEDNDLFLTAASLGAIQGNSSFGDLSIDQAFDDDWYLFQTVAPAGATHTMQIDFDADFGNLDLELYDVFGNFLGFDYGIPNDTQGFFLNGLPPGFYVARVFGPFGATNPDYTLSFHLPLAAQADLYEPNNSFVTSWNLGAISGRWQDEDLSIHEPNNGDWYEFQTLDRAQFGNLIQLDFDNYQGNLDLALFDSLGHPLAWSFGIGNQELLSLGGLPAGNYHIWVGNLSGGVNPNYTLIIDAPVSPTADRFEPNDLVPTDLGIRQGISREEDISIHPTGDLDFFEFQLTSNAGPEHSILIEHNSLLGAVDAVLFDAAGNFQGQASLNPFGRANEVSLNGLGAGTYQIAVFGWYGATNPQYAIEFHAPGASMPGDSFEPNNSSPTATDLFQLYGLRVWSAPDVLSLHNTTDEDWYKFELTEDAAPGHFASILFEHDQGDLDLELYDANGNQAGSLLDFSRSTQDVEQISFDGWPAGSYYLRILGHNNALNPAYSMVINAPGRDRFEDNNQYDRATELDSPDPEGGSMLPLRGLQTWSGLSIHQNDEDWFQFSLSDGANRNEFVRAEFSHAFGDLDLELYEDPTGNPIARSTSTSDNEQISLAGLVAGTYYIRVIGFQNATNALYSLSINAPEPLQADRYEENNSQNEAFDLGELKGLLQLDNSDQPLSIHIPGDEDWFEFRTTDVSTAAHFIQLDFAHVEGDLDLELRNSVGDVLATDIGIGDSHRISLATLPADTYFLRTVGFAGATNSHYSLTINAPGVPYPDWAESNDSMGEAHALGVIDGQRSVRNLSIDSDTDVDWFTFEMADVGVRGHAATLTFDHLQGAIDLTLIDPLGKQHKSNTSGSLVMFALEGFPAGQYKIKIDGETNPAYSLAITAPDVDGDYAEQHANGSDNDTRSNAYDLRFVSGEQTLPDLSLHAPGDVDWFRIELPTDTIAGRQHFVSIHFENVLGDLDLELFDENGVLLGESRTSNDQERESLAGLSGVVYAKVTGHRNAMNPFYSLKVLAPVADQNPDWAEENNDRMSAHRLSTLQGVQSWSNLNLHSESDVDWFQFDLPSSSETVAGHNVSIQFDNEQGNLNLELYREADANSPYRISANISDTERISLDGLQPADGPFYVRVTGEASPGYALIVDAPETLEADWAETHAFAADNGSFSTAHDLRQVDDSIQLPDLSIHPAGDLDFFKFEMSADGVSDELIRIDFQHSEGDLKLELFDNNQLPIGTSDTLLDGEQIPLKGLSAGVYYAKISGKDSQATNPNYSLTISTVQESRRDFAESNDTPQQALDLRNVSESLRQTFNSQQRIFGQCLASNGNITCPSPLGWYITPPNGTVADIPTVGASQPPTGPLDLFQTAFQNPFGIINNIGAATQFGINNSLALTATPLNLPGLDFADQQAQNLVNTYAQQLGQGHLAGAATSAIFLGSPFDGGGHQNLNPAALQMQTAGLSLFNPNATANNFFGNGFNPNPFGVQNSIGLQSPLFAGTGLTGGGSLNPAFQFMNNFNGMFGRFHQVRSEGGIAQGITIPGLTLHSPQDEDWYRFELSQEGSDGQFARLNFDSDQGQVQFRLFSPDILNDSNANPIEEAESIGDSLQISLSGLIAGTYFAKVTGNGTLDYVLHLDIATESELASDWAEPNDSQGAARDLREIECTQVYDDLTIHQAGNADWFEFTTKAVALDGHFVRIDLEHDQADLDIELFDHLGSPIIDSQGITDREELSLAGLAAGTYFLAVTAYDPNATGEYILSIHAPEVSTTPDELEPNNDRTLSTELDIVTGVDHIQNLSLHAGDEDWFHFQTAATGTAASRVSIDFHNSLGDLQLELYDSDDQLIDSSKNQTDHEVISLSGLQSDEYFVRVFGASDTVSNRYQFHLDVPTVVDPDPELDEWTIMVYMTASNLEIFAAEDINEMELAASILPSSVNIVVLLDQTSIATNVLDPSTGGTRPGISFATGGATPWGDVGRAVIAADTNETRISTRFERIGERNTGNASTLVEFVEWAANVAPADRYALVVWDHGSGLWGTNSDDESNGDLLTTIELTSALDTLNQAANPIAIDVLSFDACQMAMAEVAHAASTRVDVFVASEENEGGKGYNYRSAFASLLLNPENVSPESFAAGIVASYQLQYVGRTRSGDDTHSATSMNDFDQVTAKLNSFVATVLERATNQHWQQLRDAIFNVPTYGGNGLINGLYRDLGRYLINVVAKVSDSQIVSAALDVLVELDSSVLSHTPDRRNSTGLSIFLPGVHQTSEYASLADNYRTEHASFVQATRWDEFLDAFVGQSHLPQILTSDWAGLNSVYARSFDLHSLNGDHHVFDGLGMESNDEDWFRFTIHQTGSSGDQIVVSPKTGFGPIKMELSTMDTTSANPQLQLVAESTNGSLSLNGFDPNEYFLRMTSLDNSSTEYALVIDAPFVDLVDVDWIQRNDNSQKPFDVGVIASETLLSGMVLQSGETEYFQLSTPRFETGSRQIRVHAASDAELTVELMDAEDNSLAVETGNNDVALFYKSGGGATYRLRVTGDSVNSTIPFSIRFANSEPLTVTQVFVGSSQWSTDFRTNVFNATDGFFPIATDGDQLKSVPWTIDQIRIRFSEHVTIQETDLVVTGTKNSQYAVVSNSLQYDSDRFEATWRIVPISVDKVMINVADSVISGINGTALDGEYSKGTGQPHSGDGDPGGHFHFRVNVLAGDADRNGENSLNDLQSLATNWQQATTPANFFVDFDGSNDISLNDLQNLATNWQQKLADILDPPIHNFPTPAVLDPGFELWDLGFDEIMDDDDEANPEEEFDRMKKREQKIYQRAFRRR